MPVITEDQIGLRIRSLRINRGLTLASVSAKANLSKSYLSKVEKSKTAPPVSTLMAIANALGSNIAEILSENEPETRLTILRKGDRPTISKYGQALGYSYRPLAPLFPGRHMDPYVITIPAKQLKSQVFQHRGEEMVLVTSGRLCMRFGDEEHVLEEGDCAYFDASLPHSGYAIDGPEVECLIVIFQGS
ncbi:MAG: XRE family transcriptional regulator [Pseudomonadota bacterium]